MNDEANDQWWVISLRNLLVWARLRVTETGAVEIFSADGETLRYDDYDSARNALLDADFRSFEGLDEDDAAMFGFDLDSIEPPRAEDDEELLPMMTEKLVGRDA